MVWEMFKLRARSLLSTHINRLKKSSKIVIQQATEHLQVLEEAFHRDPSSSTANNLKIQTCQVSQLHIEKAKQHIFCCKQNIFEYGERSGKLLAYLAHLDSHPPVVVSLADSEGNDITEPQQVAEEFGKFYRTLYTSQVTQTIQDNRDYLAGVNFP